MKNDPTDQVFQMELLADGVDVEFQRFRERVAEGYKARKEAQTFFAALAELLKFYASPDNWPEANKPPLAPIPEDIARLIATQLGFLAEGKIPHTIQVCANPGRTPPGPVELERIRVAMAYVGAAKSGQVPDKSPVKTVSELFGVSRRTIQQWSEQYGPCSPGDPGLAHITIESLPDLMRKAGDRHQRAGRSNAAIKRRNSKASAKTNPDFGAR